MNNSEFNVVLQRVGDEAPIMLGDEKCLIRTVLENERVDCCAIINGPNGTAIRSYRTGILVNGEPTSVRQLSSGDVIELPCETKIEVQQATQIQPVISGRGRSLDDVDQQLAQIQSATKTDDASSNSASSNSASSNSASSPKSNYLAQPDADGEETFHSPFSTDLPEITPESLGQPVASTVSPENQLTPADVSASDMATGNETPSVEEQDLEAIFAKLGVTSVGSIANPVVENAATKEAVQNSVAVSNETAETPVQSETPEQLTSSVLDDAAEIRRQLEAATVKTSAGVAAPQPVAEVPAPVVPTPEPTPVEPTLVKPGPTEPAPAESNTPDPTVEAEQGQNDPDPLSELPSDLRDQLNDLVSSLKTGAAETTTLSNPEPAAATMPQPSSPKPAVFAAAATAATAAAAAVATTLPTQAAPPQPVEPTPVVPALAVPTPAEPTLTPAAPAPAPVPEAEKNRSVADVLGAMGMDIPGDDETDSANANAASQPPTPAPTPEPAFQPAQDTSASPVFADVQNANADASAAEGDADEDIQAYMNRLLNRDGSTPQPQQSAPVVPKAGVPVPKVQEQPKPEIVPVLSEEEFVPTHKASRVENYESLREIANTTNRSAIENSSKKSVSQGGPLKIVLAIVLFMFAAIAYLFMTGTLDKLTNESPVETTIQQTVDK